MKQNIVEIQVPAGLSEAPEEAQGGVMYEHNATALRFVLDPVYIAPEYRYYLEFVTVNGVNRTEYLTPDEENAIEFSIPADITSQMTALCCLNVVAVNEAGKTEQLIKSKSVNLYFSVFENTEKKLAADYAFSVNALLEAIKNGTFKGEKGDPGEKGDAGVSVDETVTDDSQNPVSSAGLYSFVQQARERKVIDYQVPANETVSNIVFDRDLDNNPLALSNMTIYARLLFEPKSDKAILRVSSNFGMQYLLHTEIDASDWMVDMVIKATSSRLLVASIAHFGLATQGDDDCFTKSGIALGNGGGVRQFEITLTDAESGELLPILESTEILVTGTNANE